jgi:hypothetical protein
VTPAEISDAIINDPYRVEQPRRGLNGALRRITRPRSKRHLFLDHAPQPLDPHERRHLAHVAEHSQSHQDWVLQFQPTKPDAKIDHEQIPK